MKDKETEREQMATTTIVRETAKTENSEPEVVTRTIGPSTPIQLGMIVGLIASIIGAIWWASKVDTKLDFVARQLVELVGKNDSTNERQTKHEADDNAKWSAIDSRLRQVETVGSDKARELEKRIISIERDFQVHEKLDGKLKP